MRLSLGPEGGVSNSLLSKGFLAGPWPLLTHEPQAEWCVQAQESLTATEQLLFTDYEREYAPIMT